jgi:hypothetical protein
MKRFLLLALLATPALAATPDPAIVDLVRKANSSPEPVSAVFSGLAALPDLSVDGASFDAAIEAGGAPRDGLVAKLLGGLQSVTKNGNRLEMRRAAPITVQLPASGGSGAYVSFDKTVSFKTSRKGSTVDVSEPQGVQVGESPGSLYALRALSVTPNASGSSLSLTAGAFIFSKTKTIQIPAREDAGLPLPLKAPAPTPAPTPTPAAPAAVAETPPPPPVATPGMVTKLGE